MFKQAIESNAMFGYYNPTLLNSIEGEYLYAATLPDFSGMLAKKLGAEVVRSFAQRFESIRASKVGALGEYHLAAEAQSNGKTRDACKKSEGGGTINVGMNEFLEYTYEGTVDYSGSKCSRYFVFQGFDWGMINMQIVVKIKDELGTRSPFSSGSASITGDNFTKNFTATKVHCYMPKDKPGELEVSFNNNDRQYDSQGNYRRTANGEIFSEELTFRKVGD